MSVHVRIKHVLWERGTAFYRRKIPVDLRLHYSPNGKKVYLKKSLHTQDHRLAERRRDWLHVSIEAQWENLRTDMQEWSQREAFDFKVECAKRMGFDYKSMETIAHGPVDEMHQRMSFATEEPLTSCAGQARAEIVLGVHERPVLDLENFFDEILELYDDKLMHKTDEQIRVWSQARLRAVNNLIDVIGNKAFDAVTRDDARRFRSWWMDRVKSGEVKEGTANKDFEYLRAMFGKVIDGHQLDEMKNVWSSMAIEVVDQPKRPSLTREETISSLFAGNPLWSMDPECRAIVEICAELGARPKEIMTREPADIVLDAPIPHVKIRPNKHGRRLKTKSSERDLPLVGAALRAFQKYPNGFPRYREKTSSAITAINKYFRNNKIMPEGRTLYSLRHAFEDRLLVLGTQEKVKKILMGHSRGKIDYGDGPPLAHALKILEQIVLQP